MWIKKKDKVIVLAGKDKGKRGEVLSAPKPDFFLVSKLNMVKKHQKTRGTEVGGIIQKEMGMHRSKLMLVCPQCEAPNRFKIQFLEDGSKTRVCLKCSARID